MRKKQNQISISYSKKYDNFDNFLDNVIPNIKKILNDLKDEIKEKKFFSLNERLEKIYSEYETQINDFFEMYKDNISIINPNKWKFHQTVFEQHYYQQLRNFSYELERENTILIAFGFSFADEHINEILQRALTNPTLEFYIISHSKNGQERIKSIFKDDRKIDFLPDFTQNQGSSKIKGDFSYFISFLEC